MIFQGNAAIRRYYGIDPGTLTDDEWCRLYAEYQHTTLMVAKQQKASFEAALIEIINKLFPDQHV